MDEHGIDLNRVRLADRHLTELFIAPEAEIDARYKNICYDEAETGVLIESIHSVLEGFSLYEIAALIMIGKTTFLKRVAGLVDIIENPEKYDHTFEEDSDA